MVGEDTSNNTHFPVRGVRERVLLVVFLLEDLVGLDVFFADFFLLFFDPDFAEDSDVFFAFSVARVRLAASTRFPMPRCSRAS